MFKNFMKIFQKSIQSVSVPVVPEFEVYFPGTYDNNTKFASVAFTGTEEACRDFAKSYKNPRSVSVRPTGQMTTTV